jgi:hypothetical protein
MALPTRIPTNQHDCEYRPDIDPWPILPNSNNLQDTSSPLRAPGIKSVAWRRLHEGPYGQAAYTLERMNSQEIGTSTLDRLAGVIAKDGVEAAWEGIGDIAASYNVSHRGCESVFKIHEFYRPYDYTTPADLMMIVADTAVQLRDLCASEIGRALLQQLFSIRDSRGQRISTISAEKIKETITGRHEASHSPYLVHMSSDHLYISWKTVGWWEVYDIDSLDILLREALDTLPCTILRPQPSSAWIKKYKPTVSRPASSWECTVSSPRQPNTTPARRSCDGSPLPSAAAVMHSTRPRTGESNCELPLASPTVTKQACKQASTTNSDGLAAFMCHATESLPPMTSCESTVREFKYRRLWRKLMCM